MKLHIYLTPEGAEALSLGKILFPWHFSVKDEPLSSPEYLLLGEFNAAMPSREDTVRVAVSKLDRRLKEVYLEAESEAKAINERKQNLLSLAYSPQE